MQLKVGDKIGSRGGGASFVVRDVKGGPGKSGFGIVYISYCEAWKQMVAVKSLQDRYFYRGDRMADKVVEDFYREAETWVKLERHPNIVEAITVGKLDWGQPYIVLEYVDGGSLGGKLVDGRLNVDEALKLGVQFCHGMIYANTKDLGEERRGIVHRDIKPANIMLTQNGVLKITDFGLVKALGAPSAERPAGTPEYMSPEQFRTMDVDQRSDIYSFGAVMYEMLTGTPPFYTDAEEERWDYCKYCHQGIPPKEPSQMGSSVPSMLERAVLKCLEKRPGDRYESFEALEKELVNIYQSLYGGRPEMKEEVEFLTAEAWSNRGASLLNLGKYDEALEYAHKALQINPESEEAWHCSGVAYYGLGNKEGSIRCLNKALEINPTSADAWANKGVALKDLGEFSEAQNCLNTALEISPRHFHAWEMLGKTLYDSTANIDEESAVQRLREAVQCFDRSLEINPNNPTAWNNKGAALNRLGVRRRSLFRREEDTFKEAIKCFDKAIELNPRYQDAWVSKAASLANLGRFKDALECLDRALEIEPEHVMALSHKVQILDKLGMREEARRCAAEAYFYDGLSWARRSEFWEAIKCYNEALKLNPNHARAWNNKGASLHFLGMRREAMECYDRALDIDPTSIPTLRNKAANLRGLGRLEEAKRCEEIASELERRARKEQNPNSSS